MSVRTYVNDNFNEAEQEFFDFVLNSFPEEILVQDGVESEYILFMLAALSKIFGSGREVINNLLTAHSANELYEKIESGYFSDNNKQLLLPLADDLSYPRLYGDTDLTTMLNNLVEEDPFVKNSYRFIRNRGSYLGIYQVLNSFLEYIGDSSFDSMIVEEDMRVVILLGFLEDFIDYDDCDTYTVGGETYQVCRPAKSTVLYDLFMSIKPAGVTYDIFIKYTLLTLYNILSDRIIRDSSYLDAEDYSVVDADLAAPVFSNLAVNTASNTYALSIENPSDIFSVKLYLADWNTEALGSPINEAFENNGSTLIWETTTAIAEGTEATVITRDSGKDSITPASEGEYIVVTGYEWVLTSSVDYNSCPNKTDLTGLTDSTSKYEVSYKKFPQYSLYITTGGNLVMRAVDASVTKYWRLKRVDSTRTSNAYYISTRTGTEDFSYSTYVMLPRQTNTFSRESTDPAFNAPSYVAAYFTLIDDISVTSSTTIEQDSGIESTFIDDTLEVSGDASGNVTQLEEDDVSGTFYLSGLEDGTVSGVGEEDTSGSIAIISSSSGYATSTPSTLVDDTVEVSGEAAGVAMETTNVSIDTLEVSGEALGNVTQLEEENPSSSIAMGGTSDGYATGLDETVLDDTLEVSGEAAGTTSEFSGSVGTMEFSGSSAGDVNQLEEESVDTDIEVIGSSSGYVDE